MRASIVGMLSRVFDDYRKQAPLRFREILSAAVKAFLAGVGVVAVMSLVIIVMWLFPKPARMHVALYVALVGIGFTVGAAAVMVAWLWVKARMPGFYGKFVAMLPWTRSAGKEPVDRAGQ